MIEILQLVSGIAGFMAGWTFMNLIKAYRSDSPVGNELQWFMLSTLIAVLFQYLIMLQK